MFENILVVFAQNNNESMRGMETSNFIGFILFLGIIVAAGYQWMSRPKKK